MGLVQYPFSESVASLGSSLSLENPDDTDTGIIPRRVYDSLGEKGFEVNKDGKVTFKPNSTSHPRKWPLHRKVWESALICFLEFFMTLMVQEPISTELARRRLMVSWFIYRVTPEPQSQHTHRMN